MLLRRAVAMPTELQIPAEVCGHPGIAFGGFVAGLLAGEAECARIRFLAPTPVGTTVRLMTEGNGRRVLVDHLGTPLAEASIDELSIEPIAALGWDDAIDARSRFGTFPHPQPMCFGCGPDRAEGDGLRVFTGPVDGAETVAGPWTPPLLMCASGVLPRPLLWSALDCPGGWARRLLTGRRRPAVTASLSARIASDVRAGCDYIVCGWVIRDSNDRKTVVGSAVHSRDGQLYAVSEAVLVEPREPETN